MPAVLLRRAASGGAWSALALVYGHSFPAWLKRRARQWAERRRIPLVSVGYSNDFADEQRLDAGPIEFARLMSRASAVITNFFHGCIFALLNGKPWATAPSDYRSIKIPDLAASLGVEHRIVGEQVSQAELWELLESPVPPEICARIRHKRAESSAFLDAALS